MSDGAETPVKFLHLTADEAAEHIRDYIELHWPTVG